MGVGGCGYACVDGLFGGGGVDKRCIYIYIFPPFLSPNPPPPSLAPFPPYLADVQIPGLEDTRGGRRDGGGGPDQHVGGGQVVEQPRGVVAVGGRDDDVEDAPCAVEGLLWLLGVGVLGRFGGGGGWFVGCWKIKAHPTNQSIC